MVSGADVCATNQQVRLWEQAAHFEVALNSWFSSFQPQNGSKAAAC